jgi:choline dehydrogenase
MEATIWKGRRWSAANAYLKPAMAGGNVHDRARLCPPGGDGRQTRRRGGGRNAARASKVIRAGREVIIAASSINSPKLLMLSGIGPAAHLREHGIEVVADRKGVGANLQDHLEIYMQFAASQPMTLYKYWNLWGKAWVGAQWLLTGKGLGASNQFEACAFIRSKAGVEYPDIQYHFLPIAVRYDGKAVAAGHGFQAHVGPMRSKSRGSVSLRSGNPRTRR